MNYDVAGKDIWWRPGANATLPPDSSLPRSEKVVRPHQTITTARCFFWPYSIKCGYQHQLDNSAILNCCKPLKIRSVNKLESIIATIHHSNCYKFDSQSLKDYCAFFSCDFRNNFEANQA